MPKAQHILPYTVYPKGEGLSIEDCDLVTQAKAATHHILIFVWGLLFA